MSTQKTAGNALAPMLLDGHELAELEQALADVESGRGVLVRLADLMGGAVGHAARLGLRGLGMAPNMEEKCAVWQKPPLRVRLMWPLWA